MSTQRPNHARTAAGRRGCNRRASWPPSGSLGVSAHIPNDTRGLSLR